MKRAAVDQLTIQYRGDAWNIKNLRLKLALKYGILKEGWNPNPSIAFDIYALSRGPAIGSPTLADFAMTQLMNSRVTSADMATLHSWLRSEDGAKFLKQLRTQLLSFPSLEEATDGEIELLGNLIDRLLRKPGSNERVFPQIGEAKVYKWLAAWAPDHIPMMDRAVRDALTGMEPNSAGIQSAEMLRRFSRLLNQDLPVLKALGTWLYDRLRDMGLQRAVPPARVLDSLLWCEWIAFDPQSGRFGILVHGDTNEYRLTPNGEEMERRLLRDLPNGAT